jgi:hypothetical protein
VNSKRITAAVAPWRERKREEGILLSGCEFPVEIEFHEIP